MRSKLFDDVVQSFVRLPLTWGEGGTDQCFIRAMYGLPISFHIGAMEGALARALPGVEHRWPSEAAPRQLVTDLRGWLARYGPRRVPVVLTQEDAAQADAGFADAALAALNGIKYAEDAGVLAVSTACCVGSAIHSVALSVWEQNDPEAANAAPEDWYAGRFEKERWFFDNPEIAEITRAEWTRVVENLLAAGVAEVPLPDANGVAARERALERWKANSGIFISPSRARESHS